MHQASTASATPAKTHSPKDATASALRALESWVAAQNAGKVDAYLAHYDPATFRGVLRTSDGGEKKLDFAAWKEQRGSMIKAGNTVAAESPKTVTWADNPALVQGIVEVRFTQRWKNAKYGDHGPKILQFRTTDSGTKIVYEEMVSSTPGWSDTSECSGDQANSELPCTLKDTRLGWCKGGVCKDVCPAGHSYSPNDTRCHQPRDCAKDSRASGGGAFKTGQCNECMGMWCMDPNATRDMKP